MRGFFNFLSGIFLFYLLFLFLRWYIKGHFGKYFIFFWAYTIFTIFFYLYKQQEHKKESNPKSGYEVWQDNMKDYDAEKGY